MTRSKAPIASKLVREPSQLELFTTFGEGSEEYTTVSRAMSYFHSSGLPKNIMDDGYSTMRNATSYRSGFHSMIHWWRDLFADTEVVRKIGQEIIPLPIAELHRPKIQGCTAGYKESTQMEGDFSLGVKIFGVGFGQDVSRTLGFNDEFETTENCIRLSIPITIEWIECKFKRGKHKGIKFPRSNIKNIGKDWTPVPLDNSSLDRCNIPINDITKAGWDKTSFSLPKGTTWNRTLSKEISQASEISLETKIANIELGPKAVVKYLKNREYSYSLVGPHSYTAYSPKNSLTFFWNST